MTFKEHEKYIESNPNFYIWKALVASEVSIVFDIKDDELFEYVCNFVYEWIMNVDILPKELVNCIKDCIYDNEFGLDDFNYYDNYKHITDVINQRI